MKKNCKSAVMINDQQDKMEIPFEIPILIDNSFSVLKHNSYACGYHTYTEFTVNERTIQYMTKMQWL